MTAEASRARQARQAIQAAKRLRVWLMADGALIYYHTTTMKIQAEVKIVGKTEGA